MPKGGKDTALKRSAGRSKTSGPYINTRNRRRVTARQSPTPDPDSDSNPGPNSVVDEEPNRRVNLPLDQRLLRPEAAPKNLVVMHQDQLLQTSDIKQSLEARRSTNPSITASGTLGIPNQTFQFPTGKLSTPPEGYSQSVNLSPQAAYLLYNSIPPSVRQNYDSSVSSYISFATSHGYKPFPATIRSVTDWLAFLLQKIKPDTAKAHIDAIRFHHLERNFDTTLFDDKRIDRIIRGAKRYYNL